MRLTETSIALKPYYDVFELIIQKDHVQKGAELEKLMTAMERAFQISTFIDDPEWQKRNQNVISLYKMVTKMLDEKKLPA